MSDKAKLGTESYKGVRDFYPEESFQLRHIFGVWRTVVESFGYVEYKASILEPAELYRAKTGDEIVNEQTYTFTDRGGRDVTLRPEMTPTVARMVAAKQNELAFPLRWYSIPNLFRYEKPQRGRLREHWQLNVDLFGVESGEADREIICVSSAIMKKFGATEGDFEIRINSRKIMNELYERFNLDADASHKVAKLIDKKNKIPAEVFEASLKEIVGERSEELSSLLSSGEKAMEFLGDSTNVLELRNLLEKLPELGVNNAVYDPTLMRGFDYYTGMVFEVFDLSPENNRSVFGGGRYDDLLDIFGAKKVPAVGFGAGDVTARDFLESHNMLPEYKSVTDAYICTLASEFLPNAEKLAESLRKNGINVAIDFSGKKVGDQVKSANKQSIPFVIVIGEDEAKSDIYPVKHMKTGAEEKLEKNSIADHIRKNS